MAAEIQRTKVVVPNVGGISQDVAAQILQTVGLKARVQHASSRSLLVVKQEPVPGTLLSVGSEVVLSTGNIAVTTASQPTAFSVTPEQSKVLGERPYPQQSPPISSSDRVTNSTIMVWYPKQFLSQEQPQPSVFQTQARRTESSNILRAPSSSGEAVPLIVSTGGWREGWFAADRRAIQGSDNSAANTSRVFAHSSKDVRGATVVPVPRVIRLPQEDARTALQKSGLSIGTIIQVENFRLKSGLVLRQFPQARSIVPVGTEVQLWVVK